MHIHTHTHPQKRTHMRAHKKHFTLPLVLLWWIGMSPGNGSPTHLLVSLASFFMLLLQIEHLQSRTCSFYRALFDSVGSICFAFCSGLRTSDYSILRNYKFVRSKIHHYAIITVKTNKLVERNTSEGSNVLLLHRVSMRAVSLINTTAVNGLSWCPQASWLYHGETRTMELPVLAPPRTWGLVT